MLVLVRPPGVVAASSARWLCFAAAARNPPGVHALVREGEAAEEGDAADEGDLREGDAVVGVVAGGTPQHPGTKATTTLPGTKLGGGMQRTNGAGAAPAKPACRGPATGARGQALAGELAGAPRRRAATEPGWRMADGQGDGWPARSAVLLA